MKFACFGDFCRQAHDCAERERERVTVGFHEYVDIGVCVCVCVCVCVRPCYYEVLRRASKCLPYAFLSLLRSLACLCVKYETDAEKNDER